MLHAALALQWLTTAQTNANKATQDQQRLQVTKPIRQSSREHLG